jgi:hypothetical protein
MRRVPTGFRSLTLWLALSGLLLRALIPGGFMPGWTQQQADGTRSWLVICHAGELQSLLRKPINLRYRCSGNYGVAAADNAHTGHQIGEAHLGCPFAAAATPALPTAPTLPFFISAAHAAVIGVYRHAIQATSSRRLPPARAPPLASVFR